uniref:NADH:ubiquinone reductase (H(+)-translocating) n=1 Tax=Aacanthocnema dobsoni TaxID=399255 RepID=A0A344A201_9HEMI|nr:NADH dehydrogenase subunit 5 [Aacanthocnema dobsoni]AWU48792.1 NADH dehydrogenase subunit 5 [Aacanthocnema dobsoni]
MKKMSMFQFLTMVLFLMSILFLLMAIVCLNKNYVYLVEIDLLMLNSLMYNFIFYMDWMSFSFSFIVLLISSLILIYSSIYLGLECNRFLWLTFLFVLFMIIMIFTPSCLGVLLGWDGLGMISYCLIIYYKSSDAFNSGFITSFTNRIGDSMLMLSIVWFSMEGVFIFFESFFQVLFFILACMTKSAQFPFSAWLPSAMAAPTPISSLVHSSTLVTAGVYLLIRFFHCYNNSVWLMLLLISSLLTTIVAGMSALYEYDLKRIIALSTLGQLGFMVMILCVGYPFISFFHLVIHAIFKALLFMCAGSFIHNSMGIQDLRKMGSATSDQITYSCFFIALINLMGIPFTSGFYSKDSLIELSCVSIFGMGIILIVMVIITAGYSVRMIMFFNSMKSWIIYRYSLSFLLITLMILSVINIFMGSMMLWMLEELDLILLKMEMKMMIIIFLSGGVIWHGYMNSSKSFDFFGSTMFFMMNITKLLSKFILLCLLFIQIIDQGFFESVLFNYKKKTLWFSYCIKNISKISYISISIFSTMILFV